MNDDGFVTPKEFAKGLKDLGMPGSESLLLNVTKPILEAQARFINDRLDVVNAPASIARATPQKIPVQSIGYGKHDSDTDSYVDDKGTFNQKKFNAMFARADTNQSGALDLVELLASAASRAESVQGLAASTGEFVLTWALGADVKEERLFGLLPDRNAISKTRLSKVLRGQGFYEIANERAKTKP
jgi:hypothetical protein